MARQNGDTHQESYVPTTIKAAQLAQLKAKRDTTIIGSTVSGKKVEVDTGRDLHIQSLQDVDNFKEHSKSAGFSVSSNPNFKNPTGSISVSVGRIDSKWKSVTHQAGIYAGEDGYDIHVGNGTRLEGAVINSAASKAKNTLTTKSLEMKDIQNEAEYTYSNNGIGYNYYGSKKKLEEMKTNDKKGYDKIYNSIGLVPNLGVGSKGKANSTTQSAISDGILTVDGKEIDTKTINTNTENTLHQLDKIFDKKKIEERQELARLFSKNAFEQLHNWQSTTKDGKVAKSIAHGVVGELAARMAGNVPGSGFKATMSNEMLIREINKVAKHDPAVAQWLSVAVGGVVNKVGGKSSNSGAATTSYATKWNEGAYNVNRVDLDGISEENKDLALAHMDYLLANNNRSDANKVKIKKKYVRDGHLYSEAKGISANIPEVGGFGFSRGYGVDSEGHTYLTDSFSMGPGVAPVQNTISDTKVLWGSKDFTGPSLSINLNTFGGKTYSISPSNITESKTLNVSPEATISASYTVKLEDSPVRVVEVEGTNIDLKTYTPVQPTGIYSPPPKEYPAEIRATNQEESTENRIRAIRTQFEIED